MNELSVKISRSFSILLFLVSILLVTNALSTTWRHYEAECSARDVLTWDGNLRYIESVDQYQDLRRGEIGRALLSLLDAPTWPTFRNVLSIIGYLFAERPEPMGQVIISFAFYGLTFLILYALALKIFADSPLIRHRAAILFFFTSLMLLHSPGLPAFALSGMLESQGMFFMLLSAYFLYELYRSDSEHYSKKMKLGLFLGIQGVVHTKYPYGAILLIALFLYEVLREPDSYRRSARWLYENRYGPKLLLAALLVAALFIVLAKLGYLGDASTHAKFYKQLVYIFLLIALIDIHIFAYRRRESFWPLLPESGRMLYLTAFLPALLWIFLHPTRFNTLLGTQQRIVSGTSSNSYFSALFTTAFSLNIYWIITFLLGLTGVALLFYVVIKRERGSAWRLVRQNPLVALLIITLLQLLLIEFTTSNRQDRHLYHLLPLILLVVATFTLIIPALLSALIDNQRLINRSAGLLYAGVVIGGVIALNTSPGYFSSDYYTRHKFCANQDYAFYEPARWYGRQLTHAKKYILINTFHDLDAPLAGRYQATAVDVFTRQAAFAAGDLRNDSRHRFSNWRNYDRLLVSGFNCESPALQTRIAERASATGAILNELNRARYEDETFCLIEYAIIYLE